MKHILVVASLALIAGQTAAGQSRPRFPQDTAALRIQSEFSARERLWDAFRNIIGRPDSTRAITRLQMRADSTYAFHRRDCPMPVAVPDTTRLAPMPRGIVRPEALPHMPTANLTCYNRFSSGPDRAVPRP